MNPVVFKAPDQLPPEIFTPPVVSRVAFKAA